MKNWMANVRDCGSSLPSGAVRAPRKPITKDPVTLTLRMPHGNVSPTRDETRPFSQNRATLPSAPPMATQRYASIKKLPRGFDSGAALCRFFHAGVISAETVRRFSHSGMANSIAGSLLLRLAQTGNHNCSAGGGCGLQIGECALKKKKAGHTTGLGEIMVNVNYLRRRRIRKPIAPIDNSANMEGSGTRVRLRSLLIST